MQINSAKINPFRLNTDYQIFTYIETFDSKIEQPFFKSFVAIITTKGLLSFISFFASITIKGLLSVIGQFYLFFYFS
jgi:hypothetical protein